MEKLDLWRYGGFAVLLAVMAGIFYIGSSTKFWLGYKVVYTVTVVVFGAYILRNSSSLYIKMRSLSLMFFQFFLAFLLPLTVFTTLGTSLLNAWPFVLEGLMPWNPPSHLLYSALLSLIFLPLGTYFAGRRLYCGFMCTCAALAETLGDPFRVKAPRGRIKKLSIALPLYLIALAITVSAYLGYSTPYKWYLIVVDIAIGHALALAAFPFFGGRVWCRFFCPLGALLGLISRAGRFEIEARKERCIHCGRCSEVCHMGIEVMGRVQREGRVNSQHCVGCGECVEACPTEVLSFRGR